MSPVGTWTVTEGRKSVIKKYGWTTPYRNIALQLQVSHKDFEGRVFRYRES